MGRAKTIGIIGQGNFGKFFATLIPDDMRVVRYDAAQTTSQADFTDVSRADIVVLAVPLQAYPEVLAKLADTLQPETLVIDVCSVKVYPQKLLDKYLPGHVNLLVTHPLFGPQSASTSTKGHRLIVARQAGDRAQKVLEYCRDNLELEIINMSAEEHDKIMADVHALTFFVARALSNMNLQDNPFMTPSYQMILDFVQFDHSHSNQLFETIEQGNPYAGDIRDHLVATVTELAAQLNTSSLFTDELATS